MTIQEVISNIVELSEDAVIYAKKVDAKFHPLSEVVLLELSDEDLELPTKKVAEKHCPGYDYFLEGFIVKEMVQDMRLVPEYESVEKQVNRIIYYAEFDA
ncbi:hypothetical protein [Flavihumibacter petaseus]|uniref:Uncharacterized protein n=1 Tax=Flavihumibacter petaseus NBRC 106054 TaxID=1220578 RepID=A0A0E9N430_9BACT|nr:hypothetical protein [Flavihumibacter petaseus]GAO44737.1 hypothetical protein FPE01S_03_07760 [Flavihumibacter petaseus NBRC 106054]